MLKSLMMVAVLSLSFSLSACGHKFMKGSSCCESKSESKKDCKDGECELKKDKSDCCGSKADEKTGK